jgi:hypothetical protein
MTGCRGKNTAENDVADGGAAIAALRRMARLRAAQREGVLRVIISGRLTRSDMRRLEHVCGPALVSEPPNLELDLQAVTYVDATAHAIVNSIASRGARVLS